MLGEVLTTGAGMFGHAVSEQPPWHSYFLSPHAETTWIVRAVAATAPLESYTTKRRLNELPSAALVVSMPHAVTGFSLNRCPEQVRFAKQSSGGQMRMNWLREPSSASKASAPGSHGLSAVGSWSAVHARYPHPRGTLTTGLNNGSSLRSSRMAGAVFAAADGLMAAPSGHTESVQEPSSQLCSPLWQVAFTRRVRVTETWIPLP